MTPGEPFPPREQIGPAVQEVYEHLNLSFSQTVLLLPPAPGRLPPRAKTSNPHAVVQQMGREFERVQRARTGKDVDHLRRVADWLVELLVCPFFPRGGGSRCDCGARGLIFIDVLGSRRMWMSCNQRYLRIHTSPFSRLFGH
jgi:hypothetical protein